MSEEPISRKRKIEAVGAHVASAAVGDLVSRTISAVIGRLDERPGAVDGDVVERLDTLVTMVRSAVEAAEVVHIRNWWLRRWLWKLRDAACEGAAVVRSFRQRAAEEGGSGVGTAGPWWARLLRSARSLFSRDGSAATLRREVRRLEDLAAGIGDFLKLLDKEIRLPSPPQPRHHLHPPGPVFDCARAGFDMEEISEWESLPPRPVPAHRAYYSDHRDIRLLPCRDGASESGSKGLDRSISVVIRFAVGVRVIWFAFQVGSEMMRGRAR